MAHLPSDTTSCAQGLDSKPFALRLKFIKLFAAKQTAGQTTGSTWGVQRAPAPQEVPPECDCDAPVSVEGPPHEGSGNALAQRALPSNIAAPARVRHHGSNAPILIG